MLTDQELRQAVFALDIIDQRGDPDELAAVLREASAKAPAADDWDNMPIGARIACSDAARRLAALLGEPIERWEAAAADLLGTGRQRVRFQAIVGYAIDLIGPCRELTGQSEFVPYTSEPKRNVAPRPTIRIVPDREAVA